MSYYKEVFKNYDISQKDIENVGFIGEKLEKYKDEFVNSFMDTMLTRFDLPENVAAMVEKSHREYVQRWYELFFSGQFDNDYIMYLHRAGTTHMKNFVMPEMVNSMQSFTRIWIHEKIFQCMENDLLRKNILLSVHKCLDATDHILMQTYYEEELGKYSNAIPLRTAVVKVSENFSNMMHTFLVIVLMLLTIGAAVFFVWDSMAHVTGKIDHLLISSLGSMLMIWVLVELLHTEIQMLRGGKFRISIIVGVALIAFIRDLLIITLKHEKDMVFTGFILTSILILGIVYMMIFHTEKGDRAKRR